MDHVLLEYSKKPEGGEIFQLKLSSGILEDRFPSIFLFFGWYDKTTFFRYPMKSAWPKGWGLSISPRTPLGFRVVISSSIFYSSSSFGSENKKTSLANRKTLLCYRTPRFPLNCWQTILFNIYIYTFPLRTSPLIPVGHHGSSNILSIFVGNRVPHGTAGWSCFPYPSRIAIKPTDGWSIKKTQRLFHALS